ncbi:MAG: hypothetical protein PSX36_11730 [bacterium]|nr:hypothetical protein [bacterium]
MPKILYTLVGVFLLHGFVFSSIGKNNDSISTPTHTFSIGFRAQKAIGFYWSNGICAEYALEKILKGSLAFGLNYISSSMGTAALSNAIHCSEINGSLIKYFRMRKPLKTLLRLNAGYAHANYPSDIYKNIPNQSMTLSLELGLVYDFKIPLRLALGGGYNVISGKGTKGLGTLYPVYGQFSIIYRLLKK